MRALVRRLHSPDVDLQTFEPDDPVDVGLLVQVMVGPDQGVGEEAFDVVVCTPRWVERRVREKGPLIGRHYLIVDRYDMAQIRHYLTTAIESEDAPTWRDLAQRISRIGRWEFEDYQPKAPD